MPGNVQPSVPNGVMPSGLLMAFTEDIGWKTFENSYPDGSSARSVRVVTSQRRFQLRRRLTPAQLTAMVSFLKGQRGRAFYFYNLTETVPPGSFDPTGSNPVGRYTVALESDISYEIQIPRMLKIAVPGPAAIMDITLRQVA